jgi:hypothetical protein
MLPVVHDGRHQCGVTARSLEQQGQQLPIVCTGICACAEAAHCWQLLLLLLLLLLLR